MTDVRAISAIPLPADVAPGEIGPRPTIMRMNPAALSVDAKYQRELSRKSITLIQKLVSGWDWRRFKPPVVARVGDSWHVIDGQHTAIAAVTHGGIGEIDVMIVDAEESIDRAKAFIGHNKDRVAITNTQIFFAQAAAGDEDALTAVEVCRRAGATILRNPTPGRPFRLGEIIAVSALMKLVRARTAIKARVVIEALVKGQVAPISADLIRAVDLILHDEQYAGDLSADDVASTLLRLGIAIEAKAAELAMAKKLPRWRATAVVIFQNTRKRRGSARAA